MTVSEAKKMWSKDTVSVKSPDSRQRMVRVTTGYTVTADVDDNIEDVLDAQGLPQIGDVYGDSAQIRCVEQNPQKVSPVYYVVLIVFEGELDTDFGSDPVDVAPTIRWRNLITEEEIDTAFDDDTDEVVPIATLNHEPVRGITERTVDWVAQIERNYAFGAFDLPSIHEYLRSVNDDVIVTNLGSFAPGVARLTKFEPIEAFAESVGGYVKVAAEVTFRYPYNTTAERAWYKRYLHQGYVMRVRKDGAPADGSEDRFVNAIDSNRDTSIRPILLDDEGFPIPDPTLEPERVHFREQRTLIKLPYAALGLF